MYWPSVEWRVPHWYCICFWLFLFFRSSACEAQIHNSSAQLFPRTSCKTGRMLVPHSGGDLFPLLHIHSYNKMFITLANWNESVPCNQKKLIKTIRKYRFKNRQCDNNDCIEWCVKININAKKKCPYSDRKEAERRAGAEKSS